MVENHALSVTHDYQIHILLVHYLSKYENNPDWQKPEIKPYLHQLSLECIEEITVFMESIDTEEMDCDTCLIIQEILCDEIEDEEFLDFAIDNMEELLSYITKGNLNIRIHRDIAGEMWFGVG